jgi:hypothetical protein
MSADFVRQAIIKESQEWLIEEKLDEALLNRAMD